MTEGFTPDQERVLEQVQKLLNLAAKNPNENEAAAAAAKAQQMLAKHNLSTAALERASGTSGKRAQEEVEGGFYRYQRDIWSEVAKLNFCLHWVQKAYVKPDARVRGVKYKRRHVLVGRLVNVRTTINLSNYLLAAIERLTREVCEEKKLGHLSGWAMSFREGCAYRLTTKLVERRQEVIDAEAKAAAEAWERAAKAGTSLGTALTIASYTSSEKDANRDHVRGVEPGTTAKERAEAAAEQAAAEAEYTRWAAENPEEAKAKEEAEEADRKKRMARYSKTASDDRYGHVDNQAFWEGDRRAKAIGLDPQASGTKVAGRLR